MRPTKKNKFFYISQQKTLTAFELHVVGEKNYNYIFTKLNKPTPQKGVDAKKYELLPFF